MESKVRENRLRRVALRRGRLLTKNRTRDPLAIGYGTWTVDGQSGLSMDEVEQRIGGM